MGTMCTPQHERQVLFSANFTAPLKQLFQGYNDIVVYLRKSQLFASAQDNLIQAIEKYLLDPITFNIQDPGLVAIDSAHKLHPVDYNTPKVTKQWLLNACLRQHKFIEQFPLEHLNYDNCYRQYVQFLYVCSKSLTVVVPNKMADFMWHSHMQHNELYKKDMIAMLGKVLDHRDDYSEEELKKFQEETKKAKEKLLKSDTRGGAVTSGPGNKGYQGYNYIHYGNGICGGHHNSHDHRKSHSGDHKHKEHHHHKHEDYNCGGMIAPIIPNVQHHHHHHESHNHNHETNTHDIGHNDTGGGHSVCGGNDGGGGGNDGGGGGGCGGGGCGGSGGD